MTSIQEMILKLSQHNHNILTPQQKLKYESIWFGIVTNPTITESYQKYQNYITTTITQNSTKKINLSNNKKILKIESIETNNQLLFKQRETKRKTRETTNNNNNNNEMNNFGLLILPKEKEILKLILNDISIVSKIKQTLIN